jgi:hypothetical protein
MIDNRELASMPSMTRTAVLLPVLILAWSFMAPACRRRRAKQGRCPPLPPPPSASAGVREAAWSPDGKAGRHLLRRAVDDGAGRQGRSD